MRIEYLNTDTKETLIDLARVVTEKYGKPTTVDDIEFFKFNEGKTQWNYFWDLSTKGIQLGISELSGGGKFRVSCIIYDNDMLNTIAKRDSLKNDSIAMESSKNF